MCSASSGQPVGCPRHLGQQLLLPYKAGAGPCRGRGCGRSTSSKAVLAVRGWPGSAEAAGAREHTEPAMGKSGEPAAPTGPGCGMAQEPRTRDARHTLPHGGAGSPQSWGAASARDAAP